MTGRKRLLLLVSLVALVAIAPGVALADPPPGPYFNGFETNTAGWSTTWGNDPSRTVRIRTAAATRGIPSASGSWHARLGKDPSPDSCNPAGGPQPVYGAPPRTGAVTARSSRPVDTPPASTSTSTRSGRTTWTSDSTGRPRSTTRPGSRRDFVFNVGTEPLGFVISGSNNATRCGATPADPGATVPVTISGWYTFEHVFTGAPGGPSPSRCA